MPAVKSTKNPYGTGTITESTVNEIHKVLRSCFRQAVKWDMKEMMISIPYENDVIKYQWMHKSLFAQFLFT